MHLKHISKWVMITGTLLIWSVKFLVRPFVHIPVSLKPFVGLMPNLVGSFMLPFGACLFFQRFFRFENTKDLAFACSFGLLMVIVNEYLQRIPVFGRTFDYLDILSSVVGVFIGHLVFARCMSGRSQVSEIASDGRIH
jgi:glycopeptide antibiotics resistance protein